MNDEETGQNRHSFARAIIVVAVIGLVYFIVVPAFVMWREEVNHQKCLDNLKIIDAGTNSCTNVLRIINAGSEKPRKSPCKILTNALPLAVGQVMTRMFLDSKGEMLMVNRLYSEDALSNIIVRGMAREKVMVEFGHPACIATDEDGAEEMQFVINPSVWKNVRWQLTGFNVITKDDVVLRWVANEHGGVVNAPN